MKRYLTFFLSMILCALPATLLAEGPPLKISEAWVQEGPPNARVLAGFMLIKNPSDKTLRITAAQSSAFKAIEFHRTVHSEGMARMQPQAYLDIAAGQTLKLEHGGYHLMLMQPLKRLKSGDTVEIQLKFQSGACMLVDMRVRRPDGDSGHHHHHHHH